MRINTVTLKPHLLNLNVFGRTAENTFIKYLIPEKSTVSDQFTPRQISNIHYTFALPENLNDKGGQPILVAASKSCAEAIGLDPAEFNNHEFVEAFCGNSLLPGLDTPYCTIYGCHSFGQWFGQLGDGRAINLGEVQPSSSTSYLSNSSSSSDVDCRPRHLNDMRYELQLKGSGRSPFSRGFDGRAVLRSSVREFIGKLRSSSCDQ